MKKFTAPPDNTWVQRQLFSWWKEAIDHGGMDPVDQSRNEFLRPSALPFCPLKVGYNRVVNGVETERYSSFNESFYTSIGTAVHELLQNFVGRLAVSKGVELKVETLGHWHCKACGRKRRFTIYKPCKCGGTPEYEEISIHWRTTVGHIDKVIRVGNCLFILDYKTTGSMAIRKHRAGAPAGEPYFPYPANRAQIMRYVGLFEKVFAKEFEPGGRFEGTVVMGAILAYVSRETVRDVAFVYLPATRKRKKKEYRKAVRDDALFVTMKEAVAKRSKKLFIELIEEKPCADRDDYDQKMHSRYDECPLVNVCFRRRQLLKQIDKALKGQIKPKD